jgi:hypothetical protein
MYCSPIRLLSLTAEESAVFSTSLVEVAKKRRHDNNLESQEVEALLQSENAATWAFHRTIAEQEGLLQFLEEAVFDEEKMRKASFLRYNPTFVQFISLPFAHSFEKVAREALEKQDDYKSVQPLLEYATFVLPVHQVIAFAPVNAHLQAMRSKVDLLSWEQFVPDQSILHFVFSANFTRFLNSLPAACDEDRNQLLAALLRILKRFRLDASVNYLKAFCASLRQVNMNPALLQDLQEYESALVIRPLPKKVEVKKPPVNRWYYVAGAAVLILAVTLLLLKTTSKRGRPPQAEDRYMEAVETTSSSDQLKSSINERNLKAFFYLASKQQNTGTPVPVQTGDNPIPGVSKLPSKDGNSVMTVRNETTADALLLYFGSDNPIVSKESRLVAVYIRRGDEYRFRFQPDFGRFNFLFGSNWVRMQTPVPFPFFTNTDPEKKPTIDELLAADPWMISDFFADVRPTQPYLNHDLTITNIAQPTTSNSSVPVYTQLNEKKGKKAYSESGSVDINLVEEGGDIVIKAKSSLYVYKSPPTFNPAEIR